MKYAVIYQSRGGNTKQLAEEIFHCLSGTDKALLDLDEHPGIPRAEMYFVGFGIRNESCSMDIIDCLENIQESRFALFATCGLAPSEKYKARLERNLSVWFPENADYLGMYLCQGNAEEDWQRTMIGRMPSEEERLREMFRRGAGHPDSADTRRAGEFAAKLQQKIEDDNSIHIW